MRVEFFDVWQAGYANASVAIYEAGTTTFADLFTDEAMTVPAANPQTLVSSYHGGQNYGKFGVPLYTEGAHYLVINSTDQTGVVRPTISSLAGEDASDAEVRVTGGSVDRALDNLLLGIRIDVLDYGEFLPTSDPADSASTNNATLAAAISVAASMGGGQVLVPAGTYLVTTLTIPANVVLKGKGDGVTVLQSVEGEEVLTVGGDRGGLEDITIDGVSNQPGSVGFYTKANDRLHLQRATLKNFETGLHARGGRQWDVRDLSVESCVTGAKLHGDNDASGGADGDEFRHNRWVGGKVSLCTGIGVELAYEDKKCWHNVLDSIHFEDNTGTALKIRGARWSDLGRSCSFSGNTVDLDIEDGADATMAHENSVVGFHMDGGTISGDMFFTGKCEDIVFDRVEFESGTYDLTTVLNQILTIDCVEDQNSLSGNDSAKWVRQSRIRSDDPSSAGVTTAAVATEAWAYNLAPGEVINVEAVVIGVARNSTDHAIYHIARPARRPGSTLAYDGQTANFTVGATLTGLTSGATARIIADADGGATGTLTLREIEGEFLDNETITDSVTGSALANGVLVPQNAVLLGATTSIQAAVETDAAWACDFAVSGDEMIIQVTGNTGDTVEWTVSAKVTSGGG